ncbi:MAG TPA: FAD-dependent oxidoreductase [Streptosporangiaceae bacterium]|nr:FAD-dependent oxidoreductase [Streptosporangiaceae bacterium]
MPADYDLIVIGGGAAGLGAARAGAAAGARTLLVSEGEIGGECTFTGCVPSKTLIEAAARGAAFPATMAAVSGAIAAIAATESAEILSREGIEVLRGRAVFTTPRGISVGGCAVRAGRFVIATGSRPAVPPVPGLAETAYLTNETVFGLDQLPGRLAVLGGGAVGCELAQAFTRLGSEVTIIEAAPRLLAAADPAASAVVDRVFRAEGITVRTGVAAAGVKENGDGVSVRLASGEATDADQLLVATGRQPAAGHLGLEAAGVRLDERGYVVTDRHLATTAPGIYAAGDVTGRMPFTHAAHAMGRLAARNALRRRWSPPGAFATSAIPWVVFTDPEVAQVGLTEAQAAAAQADARVAYLPMSEADRAVTARRTEGFVKIIAGRRRVLRTVGGGRVLGATIVAARAGEMIHEPALAMRAGMFTGRLAQTVHAYPTWSLAIQQAAAQFFGQFGGRTARPAEPGSR